MARIQTANGPSDLRPQFAGRHAGSFFQIEAWMPSEIKAISPLVDRLMRLIEGPTAFAMRNPALNSHLRKP